MQNDLTRLDKITKGCLLLADPNIINDPYFNRTVILITENSEDEVVGFIINKPLEYNFEDIFSGMGKDYIIYNGGPVNKDNLYYIHNLPDLIPNSIKVSDNLFWGGDFSNVKNLIKDNKTINKPYKTLNKPYKTINKPYKTINKPYKTLNKPYKALTKPYKTINKP